MKVYVAGPMRGLPDYNRSAFEEAYRRWTAAGHTVFCPRRLVDAVGDTNEPTPGEARRQLEHVMDLDLACLKFVDAVALLPGWKKSIGATMEVACAQFLGIALYDAVTLEPLTGIVTQPWDYLLADTGLPRSVKT